KKADDEAPHAAAFAEARAALGRKDFAAAQAALAQLPEDSVLAESAHDLRSALCQAMDEAVRDARKKAEENDAAAASERLAPVLAADPGRANAFDRAIAGRVQGTLGTRVRKALSSLHTEMALELTETAELPKAAAQLRAAIAEDPSNERAQKELQAAIGRAHEEYMRGYVAKDS